MGLIASNIAFDKVIEDPKDQASLDTLKNVDSCLFKLQLIKMIKQIGLL